MRGGGELYTIKTTYKLFGIKIFSKNSTKIQQTFIWGHQEIGKYALKSKNIKSEIAALVKDLSEENKIAVYRQISRCIQCYKHNIKEFRDLSQNELIELQKIQSEFYPNIFQLSENLYFYDGYFLPTNSVEISVFWHKHSLSVLAPSTLEKMRQKDFIDAGGFIGDSAVVFEREFCDKMIYSFEPTNRTYALMLETLRLNASKRVVPIKKALGSCETAMQISIDENMGLGSSLVFGGQGESEFVEVTTLDKFVEENKVQVGFIKVDVEGFEMEFLKGAKNTICTQKPAMLLSLYHQASDYFGIKPLIESWNLGYQFKIHKCIDMSLMTETVLFCEILD